MSALIRRQVGPVAILTLARPPVNAVDRATLDELAAAVGDFEGDHSIRSIIFTSGLDGIFCSGGDLKYWGGIPDGSQVSRAGREVVTRLARLSKPTIAAINGRVIGDGVTLALACDFRVASTVATFRLPEAGYGFIPGWGLVHQLMATVGPAVARELVLTAEPVGASRAHDIGLVTAVVQPERLMAEAFARASAMTELSPAAIRAAKCAFSGCDEAVCFASVWGKADWSEGVDAWLSKRTPVFASGAREGEACDLTG